jgi:hypothetical protein
LTVLQKNVKNTTRKNIVIKDYFVKNCINIKQWAQSKNLDVRTTYFVINGHLKGNIKSKGNTKKVFDALFQEKIIDKLPDGLK